jgi:hypothetical protein
MSTESTVFASAADAGYGYHLLNLVGSVKANSDVFDRIEVFDLGLSPHQRTLLAAIPDVTLREVPPFIPHWAQCFTWKPWAWMQIEAARVFWLDAGATVLRSLEHALGEVDERGYFLVSQGNQLRDIVPPDYFELFQLPVHYSERPYVAAGILGFRPRERFFERVLVPTYEDCLAGRNLGFSPDEIASKNRGVGYVESPPIRDCRHFRWDQTLLNIRLALAEPDANVADLDEYGGWVSPHDHPRQVIWNHRRGGSLRYLKHVPYTGRHRWRRRAFGLRWQARWWLKLHSRFLEPRTYRLKARAMRSRAAVRLRK